MNNARIPHRLSLLRWTKSFSNYGLDILFFYSFSLYDSFWYNKIFKGEFTPITKSAKAH